MATKNAEIFKRSLNTFAKRISDNLVVKLEIAAKEIVAMIESGSVPVDTGNLQDSTGIGVYNNGVLMSYTPVKIASEPRVDLGIKNGGFLTGEVWGYKELESALESAQKYTNGVWIVAFSTMPYALMVDDSLDNRGYFSVDIVDALVASVKNSIK